MLKLDPAVAIAIRVARKAAGLSQAGLARAMRGRGASIHDINATTKWPPPPAFIIGNGSSTVQP